MTPSEADELAKRIINTWRGGPPLNDWRAELEPLDPGVAGTAFVRLRRTCEDAPSIARFLAEYRAVKGPSEAFQPRDYEERISLDEYLSRLAHRASKGNADASDELESWTRWLTPKAAP